MLIGFVWYWLIVLLVWFEYRLFIFCIRLFVRYFVDFGLLVWCFLLFDFIIDLRGYCLLFVICLCVWVLFLVSCFGLFVLLVIVGYRYVLCCDVYWVLSCYYTC